jgi:ATP synthase, F1 delta subunit
MPDIVVENYAQALFDAALRADRVKAYMEQLETIMDALNFSVELNKALSSPIIPLADKMRIINKVFGDTCDAQMLNFMRLIIKNRRLKQLPDIKDQYMHLYHQHAGIWEVKAISARPLTADIMAALKDKLEKTYNRPIYLENIVDPSIIGGLKLNINGRIIDRSISTRLDAIKSATRRLTSKIAF